VGRASLELLVHAAFVKCRVPLAPTPPGLLACIAIRNPLSVKQIEKAFAYGRSDLTGAKQRCSAFGGCKTRLHHVTLLLAKGKPDLREGRMHQ
jgi:hypothetical protein